MKEYYVRLSESEIAIIKRTVLKEIPDAKIKLFGSRVDDNKKGGDIDIFVETELLISLQTEIKIAAMLEYEGIARKVDLIIKTPASKNMSIFKTIEKEGVSL